MPVCAQESTVTIDRIEFIDEEHASVTFPSHSRGCHRSRSRGVLWWLTACEGGPDNLLRTDVSGRRECPPTS